MVLLSVWVDVVVCRWMSVRSCMFTNSFLLLFLLSPATPTPLSHYHHHHIHHPCSALFSHNPAIRCQICTESQVENTPHQFRLTARLCWLAGTFRRMLRHPEWYQSPQRPTKQALSFDMLLGMCVSSARFLLSGSLLEPRKYAADACREATSARADARASGLARNSLRMGVFACVCVYVHNIYECVCVCNAVRYMCINFE